MDKIKAKFFLLGMVAAGFVFFVGSFATNSIGSNDPNGDELTLHKYIFTKYPEPKDLYDAIQRGDESYDNLPDNIATLIKKTYDKDFDGGLVVATP